MEIMNLLSTFSANSGPTLAGLAAAIVIPWMYMILRPPPPKICGTRNGPPITASRIRLKDGRYLAYKEAGVPKEQAKHKIVFFHPFGGSRNSILPVSKGLLEELGVYMVAFDRAGYGESDACAERNAKTPAEDTEQLADQLQLDKFHVIAISMGGFSGWSCLKYIPHRLNGVAMMAPAVNYWWQGIPEEIANEAFRTQTLGDRIGLRILHHAPWLFHLYSKQRFFPAATTGYGDMATYMNKMDKEIAAARRTAGVPEHQNIATQQGTTESLHRDLKVLFSNWPFSPVHLKDPGFPVHIWQGDGDYIVPVCMQRYIHERLPWIHYYELPGHGHLLDLIPGFNDHVLKTYLKV